MNVSDAIAARMSVRGYKDSPVETSVLKALLTKAQRAPSGGNVQPWRTLVISREARQAVIDLAARKLAENPGGEPTDRPIYPAALWEPYRSRRFGVGEALYAALGIPREDKAKRLEWFANNFQFFGAPTALFFVIDERMGHGQWAHMGMYMQTIALLATEAGLGTCMQECWGILRPSLKAHFGLDEHEMVYCGMALGYPDMDHKANQMTADRAPLDEIVTFLES